MQGISVANRNEMDVTTTFFFFLLFFFSSSEQTENPHKKDDRNAIGCTYLSGGNEVVFEENASTRLALI